MAGEVLDELGLAFGEFFAGVVVEGDLASCGNDATTGNGDFLNGGGAFGGATEDRFDAGEQFSHAEGFHDVVVGTELEALDAVGFFAACGEDDDGRGVAVLAEGLENLEAAVVGKDQIEEEEVEGGCLGEFHALAAFSSFEDIVAGKLQGIDHASTDGAVVFDDENGGHGWKGKDSRKKRKNHWGSWSQALADHHTSQELRTWRLVACSLPTNLMVELLPVPPSSIQTRRGPCS